MQKWLGIFILLVLFVPAASAAQLPEISCSQYEENINHLYRIIPKQLTPEQKCAVIPDNCGQSWLLFNPDGMEIYYYKSRCYMELAIKTGNRKMCNQVKQRRSIFLDGAYFSLKSCLSEIQRSKN